MRFFTTLTLCGFFAACSNNSEDPCSNLPNPCAESGKVRCSTDKLSLETCSADAESCLVWTAQACGTNKVCNDTGASPTCADCQNECEAAQYPKCSDDGLKVLTCESKNGCLSLVTTACIDEKVCDPKTKACEACIDECTAADYPKCSADGKSIDTCTPGSDGCLNLNVGSIACDPGQTCPSGAKACEGKCTDECTAGDYPKCSGDGLAVLTCVEQADTCNDVVTAACPSGQLCNEGTKQCAAALTVSGVFYRTAPIQKQLGGDGKGTVCLAIADKCPGPAGTPTSVVGIQIQNVDLSDNPSARIPYTVDAQLLENGTNYAVMALLIESGIECQDGYKPEKRDLASAEFATLQGCPKFTWAGQSLTGQEVKLNIAMTIAQ